MYCLAETEQFEEEEYYILIVCNIYRTEDQRITSYLPFMYVRLA